jgi:hypothetical protein
VILDTLELSPEEFHQRSGWELRPEGACKGDVCVPLPPGAWRPSRVDVPAVAAALGMPLADDPTFGVWALGPRAGARVLQSAVMPELKLADFEGNVVDVAPRPRRKMLLVAWASW